MTSLLPSVAPATRRLFDVTVRLTACVALLLAVSACGDDDTTPTAPTPPVNVTEVFSGVVNQNGAVTHAFTTTTSGTLTVTLTTLGPDSAQTLGMSVGTLTGTQCQTVLSNDRSTQGTVIAGGVSSLGSLCVRAYDVGTVTATEPFTYEITVVHP